MKRDSVLAWSFILITVTVAALLTAALMPANSMASTTATVKDWTCANGGFASGCHNCEIPCGNRCCAEGQYCENGKCMLDRMKNICVCSKIVIKAA